MAGAGQAVPGTVAEGGIVAHRGALRRNLRGPKPTAVPRPGSVPARAVAPIAGGVGSAVAWDLRYGRVAAPAMCAGNGQRSSTSPRATALSAVRANVTDAAFSTVWAPTSNAYAGLPLTAVPIGRPFQQVLSAGLLVTPSCELRIRFANQAFQ